MRCDRVAIVGTGLIGTSIGLALRTTQPAARVLGVDSIQGHTRDAERLGAIHASAALDEAAKDADLVVVATPVRAMEGVFAQLAQHLPAGAVVIDTGSTKAQVLVWAQAAFQDRVHFVGTHPMAGKTTAGPAAAERALFRGAPWCIVPLATTPADVVGDVVRLVESFGAEPHFLDGEEHDGLVASVSHLPYLMAVALISHLAHEDGWRETMALAATGFASATRLADSDPRMFADIVRTNRASIVRRLDLYIAELHDLRKAIADDGGLEARFSQAQAAQRQWLAGRGRTLDAPVSLPRPSTLTSVFAGSLVGRRLIDPPGGSGR